MNTNSKLLFSDLHLSKPVLQNLENIGYEEPTAIQAQSIPHLLDAQDLLGVAQTGTGKTAAFALPLISQIDLSQKSTSALVLTPTRELAIQVAEAFQTYAANIKGFHTVAVYGGAAMSPQLKQLRQKVAVVVGTPGRIMDHLRRGTLKLNGLKTLVLDEADEMLRMGFIDDVTWILDQAPKKIQIALFSATMPKLIQKVASRYLKSPKEVRIETKTTTVANVEQCYWNVSGINKLDALTRMLETEKFDGMIIFTRTKIQSTELAKKLEARGYLAAAINGDMTQRMREKNINQLKKNQIDILVATDVAARGIDVQRISHVINYDIPHDPESYIHRIGRTARAGRSGKTILFVAPRERHLLRSIERAIKQSIKPIQLPSTKDVNNLRKDQFKKKLSEIIEKNQSKEREINLDFFTNLIQEYINEFGADYRELCSALAYMAQKEKPLIVKREEAEPRTSKSNQLSFSRGDSRGDSRRGGKRDDRRDGRRDSRDGRRDSRREEGGRDGRNSRNKPNSARERNYNDENMQSYSIGVGHKHQAQVSDIVGAIANEVDINSSNIGKIKIHNDYSIVDLPADMPKAIFEHLKKVRIRNQPLNIELFATKPNPKVARKRRKK